MAGALERKVWMRDKNGRVTYPNLFVLLVGPPGTGKSQAIGPAKELLYSLGRKTSGDFKIMEGIATQAGLCERMMQLSSDRTGVHYSSMYYIGSEASDSALKNHADDFRSTACAMYDCEPNYEKSLKSKHYNIANPVMNMIAGSTFDFLASIVDQNSVMGGLASRFTYVIDEKPLPDDAGLVGEGKRVDHELRTRLEEDLHHIYKLYGQFQFSPDAISLYQEWYTGYKKEFESLESERMKSLLVRKPMLMKKVIILYAIAESDDLRVRDHHVKRAIEAVDLATKNTSRVITSALMASKDSQAGINQVIMQAIKKRGGVCRIADVKRALSNNGNDASRIQSSIDNLAASEMIKADASGNVTLLVDPDRNL